MSGDGGLPSVLWLKSGFPVMIKASENGGEKGICKATCVNDFCNLFCHES